MRKRLLQSVLGIAVALATGASVQAFAFDVGGVIGGIGGIMQNAAQLEMQKRQFEQQLQLQRLQQQQQLRTTKDPNQPDAEPMRAPPAAAAPRDLFVIDNHKIGGSLSFAEVSGLTCHTSEQFDSFEWCRGSKVVDDVATGVSILRSSSGEIAYYSKFYASALFKKGAVQGQIDEQSRHFKIDANVESLPTPEAGGGAAIASWGQIRLVKVGPDVIHALATDSPVREGVLVDFLSNVRLSARRGLPVYRLSGGPGYYWVAQWDRAGKGSLRLGIADASVFDKAPATVPAAPAVRSPALASVAETGGTKPLPGPGSGATAGGAAVLSPIIAQAEKSPPSEAAATEGKPEIPEQGRRVALVIGNAAYQSVARLQNSIADAESVYNVLKTDGFDVKLLEDGTLLQTRQAMREFQSQADDADWAVVYYAGHGIEIGGKNYLIPVDAHLSSDRDAEDEAITLNYVLDKMQNTRKLHLVILDACRDNPFASLMKRSLATRGMTRGLAPYEPTASIEIVVYSARGGEQALDGDGSSVHSPFAKSLVSRLAAPNVEINKMFRLVTADVLTATKGQQQPFVYGSIPGDEDFYFRTNK